MTYHKIRITIIDKAVDQPVSALASCSICRWSEKYATEHEAMTAAISHAER